MKSFVRKKNQGNFFSQEGLNVSFLYFQNKLYNSELFKGRCVSKLTSFVHDYFESNVMKRTLDFSLWEQINTALSFILTLGNRGVFFVWFFFWCLVFICLKMKTTCKLPSKVNQSNLNWPKIKPWRGLMFDAPKYEAFWSQPHLILFSFFFFQFAIQPPDRREHVHTAPARAAYSPIVLGWLLQSFPCLESAL